MYGFKKRAIAARKPPAPPTRHKVRVDKFSSLLDRVGVFLDSGQDVAHNHCTGAKQNRFAHFHLLLEFLSRGIRLMTIGAGISL
jgi:hypothetical protein